jgi:hypothetical protein
MTWVSHKTAELRHCDRYDPERSGNRDVAPQLPDVSPASANDVSQSGCAWDETTKPDVQCHRPFSTYDE